jgi:hypothetical protein
MDKKNEIVNSKSSSVIKKDFELSANSLAHSLERILEIKDGDFDYQKELLEEGLAKGDWDDVFFSASQLTDYAMAHLSLKDFYEKKKLYETNIFHKDDKEKLN